MGATSAIQWTDATWNPTVGCTKVSPGCDHCYAETLVNRFAGSNKGFPERFDTMVLRDHFLDLPLRWKKPRRVFVNSLSDLFHDDVPEEFIARVFAVMALAPRHTFQVLTKRHARLRSLLTDEDFRSLVAGEIVGMAVEDGIDDSHLSGEARSWRDWWPLDNVWLGVSVENQQWANVRIPALLETPAAVRFLSCEPLLGPVDLTEALTVPVWHGSEIVSRANRRAMAEPYIGWVIGGGESGPGARPMHPYWARAIRNQCERAAVPFFFKQWGAWAPVSPTADEWINDRWDLRSRHPHVVMHPDGTLDDQGLWDFTLPVAYQRMVNVGKKAAGRDLDGRTWDEYPR